VLRLPAVVTQHEDRPDTRNQLSSKPRADFLNSPQRAGNPCTLANSSMIEPSSFPSKERSAAETVCNILNVQSRGFIQD
jgi:hypothetical protein